MCESGDWDRNLQIRKLFAELFRSFALNLLSFWTSSVGQILPDHSLKYAESSGIAFIDTRWILFSQCCEIDGSLPKIKPNLDLFQLWRRWGYLFNLSKTVALVSWREFSLWIESLGRNFSAKCLSPTFVVNLDKFLWLESDEVVQVHVYRPKRSVGSRKV